MASLPPENVDESLNRINFKFKLGKQILQIKSSILSKTKTKYIRCNIIYSKTRTKDIVKSNKQDVPIGKISNILQ